MARETVLRQPGDIPIEAGARRVNGKWQVILSNLPRWLREDLRADLRLDTSVTEVDSGFGSVTVAARAEQAEEDPVARYRLVIRLMYLFYTDLTLCADFLGIHPVQRDRDLAALKTMIFGRADRVLNNKHRDAVQVQITDLSLKPLSDEERERNWTYRLRNTMTDLSPNMHHYLIDLINESYLFTGHQIPQGLLNLMRPRQSGS